MTSGSAWSTLLLAEFLAAVSSFTTEAAAALGAVQRVAEALDAEVVAIVRHGEVITSVGYPSGSAPAAELDSVVRGVTGALSVSGVGVCPAIAVPFEDPPGAALVLARSEPDGRLTREEVSVLHGMARLTSMTLRTLRHLDDERAAREESQRQATENARLLGVLTERQEALERLANEQAALRRVAVLVARGAPQEQVFAAVAEEVYRLAGTDMVEMFRHDADGTAVRVAVWGAYAKETPLGERYPPGGHNVLTMVLQTGRSTRIDDAATITGSRAPLLSRLGVRSIVASPIAVDGGLWGVITAATTGVEPIPADTERRVVGFTELVATAIANAQAHSDLAESRARVVATADQTRRQIERNLHDGAQQRLVGLALQLRAAEAAVGPDQDALRARLAQVADGLVSVQHELRELSRGLHPAMLSTGGLRAALGALVRRSTVPVEMDLGVEGRLPERVEIAAYYVVSEGLTNVAKHARASGARVCVEIRHGRLCVSVRDDGIGGADAGGGSGIVGLSDRVAALGGTLVVTSPPGRGTDLVVELPVDGEGPGTAAGQAVRRAPPGPPA